MRHLFFTLIILYFSSMIFGQSVQINIKEGKTGITNVNSTKSDITISSSVSNVLIKNKRIKDIDFSIISLENFTKNQNIGAPNTPVLSNLIEIPIGADLSVTILNAEEQIIDLGSYNIDNILEPVQRSMSKNEDESQVEFTKNESIYNTNAFYANDIVSVEILGIARDKRLARVTISPFQYNPVTNELKVIYNITASITFNHANYVATDELKAKTASIFYKSVNDFTLNKIESTNKDAITHYPTKMVIVADPMFKTQLQAYIQWKIRKGFTVIEAYTDNAAVGTTTTSIKSYLQDLYNAGTSSDPAPSFVLLVGDVAQIPTFSGTTSSHKTDLYYCEYTNDFFPEIYYGRWSAETTTQLQPQIDKTLEYEQYTMPDPSYLGDMLLVAGVDADGTANTFSLVHGNGQLEYGMDNYFNAAHGISIYEYLYPESEDNTNDPLIRADFNKGVCYANYTAHCSSVGWYNPSFITSDVPNMTNDHKYGLMVGNCCQSATFFDTECFGEAVLRKANGGAVGYIGGSNYSYWDEDYHWGVGAQNIQSDPAVAYDATKLGAYDRISHDNGEAEADWFVTNAAFMVAGNYAVEQANDGMKDYYWEIYHLMGDPSLMNYFGVPAALTVNYTDPIIVGVTTLTVNTEQYAYVAISQNNVLLDAQYSGTNTSVTLTFPAFTSIGTADIVVTKQNKQPYIGTVEIINNNIDNDALVSEIINPQTSYSCSGLTITPQVVIRNLGQNDITSVNINYSLDGGTTVTQAWTGTLVSLATATVDLADITLSTGAHTFDAYTSLPNGVTDENPSNDLKTQNIDVQDNPTLSDFVADKTENCEAPLSVEFTNNSQSADSYIWDFGDGTSTSTDVNPTHTYTALGNYTVSLTAVNTTCGNDVEIKTDYIMLDASLPCDYCGAWSNDDGYEYISNVLFNTIDNSSLESTYTDFTNISTDVYLGTQYNLKVSVGNKDNQDDVYCWIDWNKDNDFDDAGEEYNLAYTNSSSSATLDITVPTDAAVGTPRMRIRLFNKSYDTPTPCDDGTFGEVEDYKLNVIDGTATIVGESSNNIFNVFPNPNNGEFVIELSNENISNVDIYTITGEIVYSKDISSNILDINITDIEKGVYFVKVTNNKGTQIKKIVVK